MKSKPICKNVSDFSQFQVRTPIKKSSFSNYEKKKKKFKWPYLNSEFHSTSETPWIESVFCSATSHQQSGGKINICKDPQERKDSTLKTTSFYRMEIPP